MPNRGWPALMPYWTSYKRTMTNFPFCNNTKTYASRSFNFPQLPRYIFDVCLPVNNYIRHFPVVCPNTHSYLFHFLWALLAKSPRLDKRVASFRLIVCPQKVPSVSVYDGVCRLVVVKSPKLLKSIHQRLSWWNFSQRTFVTTQLVHAHMVFFFKIKIREKSVGFS